VARRRRSGSRLSPRFSIRKTRFSLQDEHVEDLDLDDEAELGGIEVYVTSAGRAYAIADRYRARGAHVVLGGLHVRSCPDEAARRVGRAQAVLAGVLAAPAAGARLWRARRMRRSAAPS
jgi:hypothetical protein